MIFFTVEFIFINYNITFYSLFFLGDANEKFHAAVTRKIHVQYILGRIDECSSNIWRFR